MTAPVPALQAGGSLRDGTLYVEREADETLPAALRRGDFCFVLAPRQIGKSSLRVRTMRKLVGEGYACAAIDLTAVGTGMTVEQWYLSVLTRIAEQLDLDDPYAFWSARLALTPVDRFSRWLRDELLPRTTGRIVLFIDEIDTLLGMKDFPRDDFFAAVRAFYNDRADRPDFARLTFCLLGVAAPGDLMADPRRTPFNIGTGIRLEDFSPTESTVFRPALTPLPGDPGEWLQSVYAWTSGHPYMTQKICAALLESPRAGAPSDRVRET